MTMKTIGHRSTQGRGLLLAGAAALALGFAGSATAQQQQQGRTAAQPQTPQGQQQQGQQQGQQQQNQLAAQIRTVEQSLRVALEQLGGAQGQPNFGQARAAVEGSRQVLGRVPQQQRNERIATAERELNEAQQALQAAQPDRERVATQLREAADAMAEVRSGLGDTASAGSAAAGSGAQVAVQQQAPQVTVQQPQPQVTVQQPAPQVTVQQPAPQVTVQQPQPQVTVRQPEPQVTVQQAEPQVRVQRQGEPQVTVQREGQPQVTVQREGQAQTDMQRQGTQTGQRTGAEQRTGASATPAPAQSGASRPAPAAATQATGMDLQSVQSLIGTNVYGANGREAGEVENLLIDSAGRVRAAVVEWGGFLGIGERQAMVPIERIQLGGQNGRATLDMTREELEALPRYDRNSVAGYASERGWGDGARLYR